MTAQISTPYRLARALTMLMLGDALAACADIPFAATPTVWSDARGDRGVSVLARDHEACEALVESKRFQLAACMESRGWKTRATAGTD